MGTVNSGKVESLRLEVSRIELFEVGARTSLKEVDEDAVPELRREPIELLATRFVVVSIFSELLKATSNVTKEAFVSVLLLRSRSKR